MHLSVSVRTFSADSPPHTLFPSSRKYPRSTVQVSPIDPQEDEISGAISPLLFPGLGLDPEQLDRMKAAVMEASGLDGGCKSSLLELLTLLARRPGQKFKQLSVQTVEWCLSV